MKEDTPSHQPVSAEQGTYAYDLSETWRAFIVVNALLIAAWLGLFALEKWQQPKHNPASLQQSAIALGDALQTDLERDTFTEQEKQSLNALFAEHGALHSASIALSNGEALYLPDQASFRSVNNIGNSPLLRWQQTLALPDDDTATITVQQLATGQRDMPQYSPYLIAALIIFNTLFAFRVRQYLQQKQLRQQTSSDTATGSSPSNRDSLSPASSEATQHTIDLIDQLTIERNELRLAQQTAVQSSQLKSKLIADTSHELLTPLNSIVGFSQLLSQSNDTLSEDNADYVQRIHHNAQHLTAIVNDMLDLSRLESGRLQLNYTSTDIYSLLFSVVYSITLDAEYKKLHVVTDLENLYGVSLSTDALRLRQIVTNLLSNAIRYTSTGFVRLSANIETNRNTQWLRVDVTDSGPGISPAQRERIFNRFNGDSADTVPMSTGLGLSIANDLVNAFGGKLSLSQPAEGGSEFTVILPLDEIHRAQATVQEDKPKVLLYCGVNGSNEISSSTHHASSAIYRAKQSQLQQYQRILAEIAEVDTYSEWTTFYREASDTNARLLIILSIDEANTLRQHALSLNELARQKAHTIFVAPCSEAIHLKHEFNKQGASSFTLLNAPCSRTLLETALHKPGTNGSNEGSPGISRDTNPERQATRSVKHSPTEQKQTGVETLIVDDNPSNVQLLCSIVNMAGCHASAAETGLDALNMAMKAQYELIFVDIRMHPMNGYELLERLRALPQYAKANIVAVTAHTSKEEYRKLIAAGFSRILHKPLSIHDVRHCLNEEPQSLASMSNALTEHTELDTEQTELPIFSIEHALRKTGGHKNLAEDMLTAFAAELEKHRLYWQTWQDYQPEALLDTVHKLHGSAQMTSVPALTNTLYELETLLKAESSVEASLMLRLDDNTKQFIDWFQSHDISLLLEQ